MKQSKFIESVTSYLHNKQHKQEIAFELQDHIDLNTQYFEDIGYDSASAFEKAELAMGDADVVGEEFLYLEKSNTAIKIILMLICVFTVSFTAIMGYHYYNFSFSNDVSFFVFVLIAINFLLTLFGIRLSYKHKRVLFNIILSASAVIGLLAIPRCITMCLYGYLRGFRFCNAFFNDLSFFYYPKFSSEKIIAAIYVVLILSQCLVLLIFSFQQRRFKTTRRLLVIKNIFKKTVLVFLVFNAILICVIMINSVYCRTQIKEQAGEELIQYSNMISHNIDAFSQCETEDVEKFMADHFPKGSYTLEYISDDQSYSEAVRDEDLYVYIECTVNSSTEEIRLFLESSYYDYFGNALKIIDIDKKVFENLKRGSSPSEITAPCFWSYYKINDKKPELEVSFYQQSQLVFRETSNSYHKMLQYNYENNRLSLYSNDFWQTENITFNAAQKKIFEDYIKKEFYKTRPNLKSLYDEYDVHYDLSYNVYNIQYNKGTLCYNVIFDYIPLYTIVYDDVLVGVNNLYESDEDELVLDDESDCLNGQINTVKMTFYFEDNQINKATINDYFSDVSIWKTPVMMNLFGQAIRTKPNGLMCSDDYIALLNEKYNTKKYYEAESFDNGCFLVAFEDDRSYDLKPLEEVLNS